MTKSPELLAREIQLTAAFIGLCLEDTVRLFSSTGELEREITWGEAQDMALRDEVEGVYTNPKNEPKFIRRLPSETIKAIKEERLANESGYTSESISSAARQRHAERMYLSHAAELDEINFGNRRQFLHEAIVEEGQILPSFDKADVFASHSASRTGLRSEICPSVSDAERARILSRKVVREGAVVGSCIAFNLSRSIDGK